MLSMSIHRTREIYYSEISKIRFDILKAMNEPETTPQYAHICSIMKNVGVRPEEQNNTNTTFGKLLIAMCQNAFEAMSTRRALVAKDRQHIESCKDKVRMTFKIEP